MIHRPSFTGARRVRDYVVGFRYRARLFRPPMETHDSAGYRFALEVTERPAGEADETHEANEASLLTVAAEAGPDGAADVLGLQVGGRREVHGSYGDIGDIDRFVERAADLVCAHLAVDRGTFRPIAGSEPPAPWAAIDPNTSPCLLCGAPLEVGDDHCVSCGAPAD